MLRVPNQDNNFPDLICLSKFDGCAFKNPFNLRNQKLNVVACDERAVPLLFIC